MPDCEQNPLEAVQEEDSSPLAHLTFPLATELISVAAAATSSIINSKTALPGIHHGLQTRNLPGGLSSCWLVCLSRENTDAVGPLS